MDISFHYFAVKTIALKAGFDQAAAQKIAIFSQYIDDYNAYAFRNYSNIPPFLKNPGVYDAYVSDSPLNFNPTTTGFIDFIDLASLLLPRSQQYTVLPFHFVPRTVNDLNQHNLATQEASLGDGSIISDCLIGAKIAYQEAAEKKDEKDISNSLMKLGMLLHTFADTCAHQKFSGILENGNEVSLTNVYDNITQKDVTAEYQSFIKKYLNNMAQRVAGTLLRIGHGLVAHVPDYTHIKWSMSGGGKLGYTRDNTQAFVDMSKKILNFLRSCRELGDIPDSEWAEFSASLRQAFLCNISDISEENAYAKLVPHWEIAFPQYKDKYSYNANAVFAGVLSLNMSPMAVKDEQFFRFVQYAQDFLITLYGNAPRENGPVVNEVCEFNASKIGENAYAISPAGMPIGSAVQINGNVDLSNIIQFNDGGYVRDIKLIYNPTSGSIYSYEVQVRGCGPKGVSGGRGYLYFTDATGDSYKLTLYKSGFHLHVVDYNSIHPEITTITWSNDAR